MPCVSSVCVCLVGGGGSHVCVHSHLYTICDLKGRTWQQRLQKCSEKYHTSTVHHLKDVTWLEWLQCILYQRMELLCHSSQTETLVHTWCDVLADDNWNCSSLHSKLVPVLFYSSSITSYVLPAVSPLPSYPPSPPSLPFSSPPLPFLPDRVALHSPLFSYLVPFFGFCFRAECQWCLETVFRIHTVCLA